MMLFSYADRGIRSKSKRSVQLKIGSNISFNNNSFNCELTSGMKYNSIILPEHSINKNLISGFTLKSYQKGNTFYIIKNNSKLIVPELAQGYSGFKLIFKSTR
jgi:hypothetical protein